MMTLGSLFDGSGGFPLGAMLAGIEPVWASEIEPFPIRVTTKRMPFVRHYGDIQKMRGEAIEPVDIITFGSPCTDLSIAGKRAGITGGQSGLFFEAIRIVREMRCATHGKYPRFIVWENVAGAFSSNDGKDFQTVLTEIVRIKEEQAPQVPLPEKGRWAYADVFLGDGWSVAYRLMDAQGWGVPQRRRRIYLVADFRGTCAGQILFDSESVCGHLASRFFSWQGAAGRITSCLRGAGGAFYRDVLKHCLERDAKQAAPVQENKTLTVALNDQGGARMDVTEDVTNTLRAAASRPPLVYENHGQDARFKGPLEVAPTLLETYGTGGNNQPLLMRSECNASVHHSAVDVRITSDGTRNARQNVYPADTARTLDTSGNTPDSNQGGIAVVSIQGSMIGRAEENGPQGSGIAEDVSFTLNTSDRHAVYAMTTGCHTQVNREKAPTLTARDCKDPTVVTPSIYTVRRLTPTECGRLQGFPDGWCADLGTDNPSEEDMAFWREVFETLRKIKGTKKSKTDSQIRRWLKNPHSDAAEYKMWGNGVALPCVFYVMMGIAHHGKPVYTTDFT